MNREPEQLPEAGADALLQRLAALAARIDRERYPGAAWPAGRRARRARWALVGLWAASAAAAVVLAALLLNPSDRGSERIRPRVEGPAQVASAPADTYMWWQVPAVDPSVAGRWKLDLPELRFPSLGDVGGIRWQVPVISTPSPEERNGTDDS